ncbi:hypothetical protein D3C85_730920 [compost metagenome]
MTDRNTPLDSLRAQRREISEQLTNARDSLLRRIDALHEVRIDGDQLEQKLRTMNEAIELLTPPDTASNEPTPTPANPVRGGDLTIGADAKAKLVLDMVGLPKTMLEFPAPPEGHPIVAALTTLKALGYEHTGGVEWRPPFGATPVFEDEQMELIKGVEQSIASYPAMSPNSTKLKRLLAYLKQGGKFAGGIPNAMNALTDAMDKDLGYAWSWHCNIAGPVADALARVGVTLGHREANYAAAALMRHMFNVDMERDAHYRGTQERITEQATPAAEVSGKSLMASVANAVSDMAAPGHPVSVDVIVSQHGGDEQVRTFHETTATTEEDEAFHAIDRNAEKQRIKINKTYDWEQFVSYGQAVAPGAAMQGLPWSFMFHGHAVTHENDTRYLIEGNTPGADMLIFNRGDIITVDGETEHIGIKSPATPDALAPTVPEQAIELDMDAVTAAATGGKAEGGDRNEVYAGLFKGETLRARAERLLAAGRSIQYIEDTERRLNLKAFADVGRETEQEDLNSIGLDDTQLVKKQSTVEAVLFLAQATYPVDHEIIKPSIGRRVWYHPDPNGAQSGFTVHSHEQPLDAGVVYVWSDRMVNLDVTDHAGNHHAFTSVSLVQPGDPKPVIGAWCEWMPYQIKQARA